jgi:hypothetical protein
MVNEVLVDQVSPQSHRVSPAKYCPMHSGFIVLANWTRSIKGSSLIPHKKLKINYILIQIWTSQLVNDSVKSCYS